MPCCFPQTHQHVIPCTPDPALSLSWSAMRTHAAVGRCRSGSDASSRCVLSDIEWGHVMQGKCEEKEHTNQDNKGEHNYTVDVDGARRTAGLLCEDSAAIPGQSHGNSDIGSDNDLLSSTAHSTTTQTQPQAKSYAFPCRSPACSHHPRSREPYERQGTGCNASNERVKPNIYPSSPTHVSASM